MSFVPGPHTDSGCITLVLLDPACPRGLEVQSKATAGRWVDVCDGHSGVDVSRALILNAGATLERWTNGPRHDYCFFYIATQAMGPAARGVVAVQLAGELVGARVPSGACGGACALDPADRCTAAESQRAAGAEEVCVKDRALRLAEEEREG